MAREREMERYVGRFKRWQRNLTNNFLWRKEFSFNETCFVCALEKNGRWLGEGERRKKANYLYV